MRDPWDEAARAGAPEAVDRAIGPAARAVVAALAGLLAGWIAAGSTGLLGHSYRRGLVWAALGCVLVAAWPKRGRARPFVIAMALALAAAVPMIACDLRPVNVLAVVLFLVAAGRAQSGASRVALQWSAEAVALLAVYRVACTSIPLVWLAADSVGSAIGQVAGALTRQALWVGATFAGLDFLVVMIYLGVRATISLRRASPAASCGWRRCALALAAILVGHLIYLNVLSLAPAIHERLPASSPPGTPWNPHPSPPGLDAAVKHLTYGDSNDQGKPAFWEPAVRLVVGLGFSLGQAMRDWVPWNLPVLAAAIHALLGWLILRRLAAFPDEEAAGPGPRLLTTREGLWSGAAVVLAAGLGAAVALSPHAPSLEGKKIVLYEKGYLNWLKPKHGRTSFDYGQFSIGMYGMMPIYLRSYGANAIVSPELSDEDLAGADVLVLIFADKPWGPGQLERIEQFVRQGGTLLVLGEHTILKSELLRLYDDALAAQLASLFERIDGLESARGQLTYVGREYQQAAQAARPKEELDKLAKRAQELTAKVAELTQQVDGLRQQFDEAEVLRRHRAAESQGPLSRFNEVLQRLTDMRVRFDSATFAIGGWLQSYEPMAHPTAAGLGDAQNVFGSVIGASVELRWPARPLLIGRWGWNDPGNPLHYPSFMGNASGEEARYDAGERLGDVVLAGEQRVDKGRVVLFGDTSGFGNGITISSHVYLSRLFAYLADPAGSPQEPGRQAAALAICLLLAIALVALSSPWPLAGAALALAISLAACTALTHRAWGLLPDGRGPAGAPNNLAYVDAAHLGKFSPESWRDDGVMGLCMNLMRNDYLALMLPKLTRERLLAPGVDLGMTVAPLAAEGAEKLRISPARGVVITKLEPGRTGDRLGMKPGDVVLQVNGRDVTSAEQFCGDVEATAPGQRLMLRLVRREEFPLVARNPEPGAKAPAAPLDLGIAVEPVSEGRARQLKVAPGEGVAITGVEANKAGDRLGLKSGMVIAELNGARVASVEEFQKRIEAVQPGQEIGLQIVHRQEFPVSIPTWTPRARLFISVAPLREFSAEERALIRDFVESGGVFLCTVGWEEAGPSRKLLEELEFYVGGRRWQWIDRGRESRPVVHYKAGFGAGNWEDAFGEPKPLGYFKSPYFNGGDYLAYVRFWTAWPIESSDPDQLLVSFFPPDVPVIVLRRQGQGLAVVVGDTAFAHNKNLENKDGSPFEGMRENSVFWRWLLAFLRNGMGEGQPWYPQKMDTVPEGQEVEAQSAGAAKGAKAPSGAAPAGKAGAPGAKPAGALGAAPKAKPASRPGPRTESEPAAGPELAPKVTPLGDAPVPETPPQPAAAPPAEAAPHSPAPPQP